MPTPRRRSIPAVLALLLAGCAGVTPALEPYRMYTGPDRPPSETAVLDLKDATSAVVNDQRIDGSVHRQIILLPGSYKVTVACVWGASILVSASGFIHAEETLDVLIQAGHAYSLHCDRTHGMGFRTYIWISDDTVDMAAAGERKP